MCSRLIGFGVRRTPKRGKTVFFARIGQRIVTVGDYPQMPVKHARKLAGEVLASLRNETPASKPADKPALKSAQQKIALGSDEWRAVLTEVIVRCGPPQSLTVEHSPAAEQSPTAEQSLTVGELVEQLRADFFKKKHRKTRRAYGYSLDKHVLKVWGSTPVAEINESVLEDWHSEGQRDHAWKAFKGILKLAKRRELIARVPSPQLQKKKTDKGESLDLKDVPKLIRYLTDSLKSGKSPLPSADLALLYILNTGERSEATCTLKPSEVNWKSRTVKKTRKGGVTLAIPVSPWVMSFLKRVRPDNDGAFFFAHRYHEGKCISGPSLRLYFQKICRKLKISLPDSGKLPVVHSLRHTFATLLKKRGVPETEIQILMGHADIATTYRYLHGSDSDARKHLSSIKVTRANLDDIFAGTAA